MLKPSRRHTPAIRLVRAEKNSKRISYIRIHNAGPEYHGAQYYVTVYDKHNHIDFVYPPMTAWRISQMFKRVPKSRVHWDIYPL